MRREPSPADYGKPLEKVNEAPTVALQRHLDMRPNDGKHSFSNRAAARAIAIPHRRISAGAAGVRGASVNPTAGRQALGEMEKRYP
jgi:hypothetical protein